MLTDEQARGIALFFLFSLMDEKIALQAAHRTVASVKAASGKPGRGLSEAALIRLLRKNFEAHRKMLARNRPQEMPTSWVLPQGVSASAWSRFHKDSSDAEIVAIVLTKILGFAEDAIAEGIGVSIGTLKYRIGKGMRQLGVALTRTETAKVTT